jgi:hypothetical protein
VAVGAWVLHVGGLALAPLSIVQAVLSGGLVFLPARFRVPRQGLRDACHEIAVGDAGDGAKRPDDEAIIAPRPGNRVRRKAGEGTVGAAPSEDIQSPAEALRPVDRVELEEDGLAESRSDSAAARVMRCIAPCAVWPPRLTATRLRSTAWTSLPAMSS